MQKNSKYDKNGNQYQLRFRDCRGNTHTVKFDDRLDFLKGLEFYKGISQIEVTSHSNTDSTNVDVYNILIIFYHPRRAKSRRARSKCSPNFRGSFCAIFCRKCLTALGLMQKLTRHQS